MPRREGMHAKAERLLLAGGVTVVYVNGRIVRAIVKGDSGAFHHVQHVSGSWSCSCPALRGCSHSIAVQRITAPAGVVVLSPDVMVRVGGVA
jgi:hypothetical protein